MAGDQWKVVIITPDKTFKGSISAAEAWDRRTTSLLNSPISTSRYTKNPIHLTGYVQLDDAICYIGENQRGFSTVSIRKSDIIFVYDEFESMGSEDQKKFQGRRVVQDSNEYKFLTKRTTSFCYQLTGSVQNIEEKFNGPDSFIPVTDVAIEKIQFKLDAKLSTLRKVPFLALNREFVASIAPVDNMLY